MGWRAGTLWRAERRRFGGLEGWRAGGCHRTETEAIPSNTLSTTSGNISVSIEPVHYIHDYRVFQRYPDRVV